MTDTINKGALCYLATPYTKYKGGDIEAAFQEAAKIAGDLMCAGINAYSPIVHSHPVAIACGLDPLDHSIWLPANQRMMEACDTLIVVTMESWQESYGIARELDWYRKQGRRIFWLDPVTMVLKKEQRAKPDRDRYEGLTSEQIHADTQAYLDPENKLVAHNKTRSEHAGTSE